MHRGQGCCCLVGLDLTQSRMPRAFWAFPSGPGEGTVVKHLPRGPSASGGQQRACHFSGGSQSLGVPAARGAGGSRPGGPGYCVIWEELNASISASAAASASERHLWKQNHRKRKKPTRESLVHENAVGGSRGLSQKPGTSLWGTEAHE